MITLGDISRRGALPALAELGRRHPEAIGAMEFVRASGVDAGTAGRVRAELQKIGIIEAEAIAQQGPITQYAIQLTSLGAEVAQRVLEIEKVLRRAER